MIRQRLKSPWSAAGTTGATTEARLLQPAEPRHVILLMHRQYRKPAPATIALSRIGSYRALTLAVTIILALLSVPSVATAFADANEASPDAAKHFDVQIAPLLARRCLECHNAAAKNGGLDLTAAAAAAAGGDSGPAFVPGKLDESYLWQRVDADEMPPKRPLSAAEKELLRKWITAGAVWGQEKIDRFRYSSDVRAGYDWWSLQPLARSAPPQVQNTVWPTNPLDQFILAKLEREGLAPAAPADRRTLIRRLSFDLTGLPPMPEDVAAFVASEDPQAYEKLVDRLLASPQYGERWARHWLDLARFGESNGFEYDEPRKNAWPYRDWVIDALNSDMPFDEFARQQLAGDVLRPGDVQAIKATGFLTAGAYDTAGQNQQSAAMKAVVRQDELEDLIATTCQTFLALTANCARCHDHKFDPIRQSEYYRLTSAFGGVRHGERDITTAAEREQFARAAAEAKAALDKLTAEIRAIDDPVRAVILGERDGSGSDVAKAPEPSSRWDFSSNLRDKAGSVHGAAQGTAAVRDGRLVLDGASGYVTAAPLDRDYVAKTLEAWVSLDDLQQAGGAVIGLQRIGGSVFDAIVFGEREPGQWMAGSENFGRTQSFGGSVETEADKQVVHVAIVYAADGTITCYRNGRLYGKPYQAVKPVKYAAGGAQVVFGLRHSPAGQGKLLAGGIVRAAIYDRALTAEEVAASAGTAGEFVSEAEILARLSPEDTARRKALVEQLSTRSALPPPADKVMCYAVKPREADPARVLARGDLRQPGEVVSAGGIASIVGITADFGVATDASDAECREALARWVTSPQNSLFARVIANRLWHYHFGVGLVDTPNDFGFNGGRPTHPELLDWLAASLVDGGYSLKRLHRTILLSATYRQAATLNSLAMKRDADNRLLWRKAPMRLEAEVVRDATLAVAGELNPQRGGPGFADSTQVFRSGTYTYLPGDPEGAEFNRRSIYRTWIRGGRSGLLDAFDCPDPSTTSPRRARTTTPLQALVLLNNSFVLRMADAFSARLEREAGANVDAQIKRAYQLAYGRDPSAEELAAAQAIATDHGLAVVARAIFNSNEFLYVD